MSRTEQGWAAVPTADDTTPPASRSATAAEPAAAADPLYAGPKTRQRIHKAPEPLAVPDIDEDAAERKRVLNVLAQRRYRERRRQKKATKASTADQSSQAPAGDTEMADAHVADLTALDPALTGSADTSPGVDEPVAFMDLPTVSSTAAIDGMVAPSALGDLDLSSESMALASFEFDLSLSTSLATMAAAKAAETGSWGMGTGAVFPEDTEEHNGIVVTTSASPPAPTPSTAINPLLTFGGTGTNTYTDLSSVSISPSSYGYSSSSKSSVTDHLSPDSYFIPVTELTLLRAVMRISARLGCTEAMWQIDGQSPFLENNKKKNNSSNPSTNTETGLSAPNTEDTIALLPANWRPTRAQRFVPHHPALDILPWPSVREKLIGLFSLPLDERPPIAADPLALVHLIYDLEDNAEGLRIWGSDPYDPTCWEVGQLVFERWWFVFDRDIIEQSDRWRELRGASRLRAVRTDTRTKGVMDMIWA